MLKYTQMQNELAKLHNKFGLFQCLENLKRFVQSGEMKYEIHIGDQGQRCDDV